MTVSRRALLLAPSSSTRSRERITPYFPARSSSSWDRELVVRAGEATPGWAWNQLGRPPATGSCMWPHISVGQQGSFGTQTTAVADQVGC